MWSLVTRRGQRVPLRKLPAVLGRAAPQADVALPHDSISARHATLVESAEGGLVVTAIGKAHVETAEGVVAEGRLTHGDTLVLGRVTLRVMDDRASVAPAGAQAGTPGGTTRATPDGVDELTLRRPGAAAGASGQARGSGSAGVRHGTRGPTPPSARAQTRAADPILTRRDDVLHFGPDAAGRGGLKTDFSQLSGPLRALILLGLALLGIGLAWGLSSLMVSAL